jgi:hypothetical protein
MSLSLTEALLIQLNVLAFLGLVVKIFQLMLKK